MIVRDDEPQAADMLTAPDTKPGAVNGRIHQFDDPDATCIGPRGRLEALRRRAMRIQPATGPLVSRFRCHIPKDEAPG
jgi:hypothetical protein